MKAVMYHYVRQGNAEYPYFRYLAFEDFCRQLDHFQANGGILARDRFLEAVKTGEPAPGYILTFDDGLCDHADYVVPELVRRGLWGVFYVPTGPYAHGQVLDVHKIHLLVGRWGGSAVLDRLNRIVTPDMLPDADIPAFREQTYVRQDNDADTNAVKRMLNYFISYEWRPFVVQKLAGEMGMGSNGHAAGFYMSTEQIRRCHDSGMIIGSHSVSHRLMSKLDEDEQRIEIDASFAWLDQTVGGLDVKTFCYPYGGFHSFTQKTEELLSAAGVSFSLNVEMRDISADDLAGRPQALPRYDCNKFPFGKAAIGIGN